MISLQGSRTRLQIARPDIKALFEGLSTRVLRHREIGKLLSENRRGWRLAQHTTVDDFVSFLKRYGELKQITLEFPGRSETLFVWGSLPLLEALLHLKDRSYFSHYTALHWHGLTEQVPKTLYITHERASGGAPHGRLTQEDVDEAFRQAPRVSQNVAELDVWRIVLLNGAFTGQLGVVEQTVLQGSDDEAVVRLTDLERTLVDAAVRPFYCGGPYEVAKAFENAKGRVSVNALSATLRAAKYVYPYHQAIGYYMERAGYSQTQLDLLHRFPKELDFYLAHSMTETAYQPTWRLHVPKGF